MTDRPIRRDFMKGAAASMAVLVIRPTRDGNAFWNVRSERDQTPVSDVITKAIRMWRPNSALKITGLEIGVSEHYRFAANQLTVRVIASTRLSPPSSLDNPRFATYFLVSREFIGAQTPESSHLIRWIHATLNGEGAFSWVGEGQHTPEAPMVFVS